MRAALCVLVCVLAVVSAARPDFSHIEDDGVREFVGDLIPDASFCTWGGYDFSYLRSYTDYLGYDTSRSFNYYMNVCGAVNYPPCAKMNNSASICQESNTDTPVYQNLGSYINSPPTWTWANYLNPSQGVTATFANGGKCSNNSPLTTTINFICSDITAPTFNVVENNACSFTFTFRIQCPVVPPKAVNCNFGGYDFSGLTSSTDYVTYGTSTNSNFYMNICAGVSQPACVAHANSSVCQTNSAGAGASSLGLYVANQAQWSWMDVSRPTKGVVLTYKNSNDRCNPGNGYSYQSTSIVNLFCSPTTQPTTLAVVYSGTCQWTFSLNVQCKPLQQTLRELAEAGTAVDVEAAAAAAIQIN